jgi:hypothetical protein
MVHVAWNLFTPTYIKLTILSWYESPYKVPWDRIFNQAGNELGASLFPASNELLMLFLYNLFPAGNELFIKLTKNSASGS